MTEDGIRSLGVRATSGCEAPKEWVRGTESGSLQEQQVLFPENTEPSFGPTGNPTQDKNLVSLPSSVSVSFTLGHMLTCTGWGANPTVKGCLSKLSHSLSELKEQPT